MLIDRTHLSWGAAAGAAFAAATVGYVFFVAGDESAGGGTRIGLVFGILALAAMVFAGFLAVKKSLPTLRFGTAKFWLRGHIWIGLLSVPLVLYHANFRFGGTAERVLMALFFIVIASGVYGLALQQVLPRLLKATVPQETFPQQIDYLCKKFREEADALIAGLDGAPKKTATKKAEGEPSPAFAAMRAPSVASKSVAPKGAETPEPPAAAAAAPVGGAPSAAPVDKAAALKAKLAAASKKPVASATPADGTVATPPLAAGETAPPAAAIDPTDKAAALKAKLAAAKKPPSAAPAAAAAPAGDAPPAGAVDPTDKAAALKAKPAAAKKPPGAGAPSGEAPAAVPADPADKAAALKAKLAAASKKPAGAGAPGVDAAAPAAGAAASAATPAATPKPAPAPKKPAAEIEEDSLAVAARIASFKQFYQQEVVPFLDGDYHVAARQKLASDNYARMAFAFQAVELPERALAVIPRLEAMTAERRQFLTQVRIQWWLQSWLAVHVPLSAALFGIAAAHIVMALRVVPW